MYRLRFWRAEKTRFKVGLPATLLQGKTAQLIYAAMNAGLKEAVERAGGIVKLAKRLGLSHQAVYYWKEVPSRHIIAIEQATGVPREKLRPDLYRLS
jgi:hypothetical protein